MCVRDSEKEVKAERDTHTHRQRDGKKERMQKF